MSTTPENPPAFPTPDVYHPGGQVEYGAMGMTLRDWFAGRAPEMPSWFERRTWSTEETVPAPELGAGYVRRVPVLHAETLVAQLARWRFHYADAMLAAREAKP